MSRSGGGGRHRREPTRFDEEEQPSAYEKKAARLASQSQPAAAAGQGGFGSERWEYDDAVEYSQEEEEGDEEEEDEDEEEEEDGDQDDLLNSGKTQRKRPTRKTESKTERKRPKKSFGPCSVSIFVGSKIGDENRTLDEFTDVFEPCLEDVEAAVFEVAEDMAKENPRYDSTKPGALYSRSRDGSGKIRGKGISLLDSQAALAQICIDAHRVPTSRQRKDTSCP